MRIKTEYLGVALQTMEGKRKELSVEFNQERLEAFKKELAAMVKREHYEDGVYIRDTDMNKIRDSWQDLMSDAGQNFINKSVTALEKRSVAEYMTVAARYLLALTFHDLKNVTGINENLPLDMAQKVARDIEDKRLNFGLSTDETFDRQRGKNADQLGNELDKLIVRVDTNKGTSEDLGKLYAEWQALSRRQAAHGFFWRMFHRQENIDRNELLGKMYGAMRGMNAGEDIVEDSTPEKIAKNHAKAKTCNAIRMNYLDMHGKTAKVFGYEGLEQQKQQEQQKQAKDNKEKNKEVVKKNGDKDRYPLIDDNNGELLKDIQDVKPKDFGEPVNEQDQVVRNNELNVK
jgi:hypothetical protein